jgi:H+/Cl- antiporter ClcA
MQDEEQQHARHLDMLKDVLRFFALVIPLAILTGSFVAFFLWSLELVTQFHWSNPWLFLLLPIAGPLTWLMYQAVNKSADGGNSLLFDRICHPSKQPWVPIAMTPLVLLGTIITHLFGGSAGREGTAVQMGGGLAGWFAQFLPKGEEWKRSLLLCGISAGFGAVFGTPVAGAIFAIEVIWLGRTRLLNLVPCLLAAVVADRVALLWGAKHSHFILPSLVGVAVDPSQSIESAPTFLGTDLSLWWKVVVASMLFGLISILFAELSHGVNRMLKRLLTRPWLRPMVGAGFLIGLTLLLGSRNYLGLGVEPNPNLDRAVSIRTSFETGGADLLSWFWKLLSTAITVGSGFKGGEVTPLFFIGATAGNTFATLTGAPVDLLAAIGFVAIFAGATKTPLACTVMGIELFFPDNPTLVSSGFVLYLAVGCFVSRVASGRSTIYPAQFPKSDVS